MFGTKKKTRNTIITFIVIGGVIGGTFAGFAIFQATMNTSIPVVVVTSGSMKPTIQRGDILFVQNVPHDQIIPGDHLERNGSIIVYETEGLWVFPLQEPVVHRVVDKKFENDTYYFLTQGDNVITNPNPDDYWVPYDHVYGKVVGQIPWIGNIKLFLDDTGMTIPLLVLFALLLVISIVWDLVHPENKNDDKKDKSKVSKINNEKTYS